jgi:hypothetical protein
MINRGCDNQEIAANVGCHVRSVQRAPGNNPTPGICETTAGSSWSSQITPAILGALTEHLNKEPELYEDETADSVRDMFGILCSSIDHR